MADLNANINVGIETTQALNQLKALQRQISQFHQSVAKSSGEAAVAQRDLQRNFLNSVNSIQGFSAELKTVRTTAESFTNSLEKNKFSMREYFRYAAGATKTFGKSFAAEFSTIERTAIERVKTLQTQYIKMGRDASGAMQAIAVRPTVLDMKDLGTQTAIAAQKQVIFNQLVKQGSTNLLNFGKNTQWAGRQLMVGFTLPLATLGMTAGRVFFDMEKAAIKFKKVYGDLFTAPEETKQAMESIVELGQAYAAYGVAVSDSLSTAADAAAAGFAGVDLQNQTAAALKLSVLGQLELQKALETTISLQNAFQLSSADLAGEIDFLNAVENQTVVSLDDITEAVPRVAPVIKQLGGNVRDLAFFLAAMKEGGVNAAQGANALKSGLASLINPSEKSAGILNTLGINIKAIVEGNQGDIAGTVTTFARALDGLDPLKRAQAIEQLFGKFQFARISALFDNITREGTQAQRVLELAGSTAGELATLSESELGVSAASSMNKFRKSIEDIKVALVPIGELFVQIATPFVEFGTEMLKAFNRLPDGVKTVIGSVITILGGIGPVALMTFGLINNGIANMIKFFATVRLGYLKITGQAKGVGDETQYMTQEQLEAAAAAASLDQAHAGLTQRFTAERAAVDQLRIAYQRAAEAGAKFTLNNPQMIKPGFGGTQAQGFAGGGVIRGPGTGTSDSIPALLSNGEAVIPAKQVKRYAPLIEGLIAGNLPGFANGVMLGMPKSAKSVSKNREVADAIYQEFLKSSYAGVAPTEYGHQIAPTAGHSFPIFGLGGVYQKGDKKVFVKPVMDETAALAEIRGTQITRQAHGLEAPEQRIVVIRDPMDPTRQRRFLALESDLDAKFIQNEPKALFNEEQYFRQLVASLVRVDKDLAAGNVFGNVVADVGPAGVFNRASGARALTTELPSMEEQALINLLGIRGGAKRAFAESTLALMAGLTPEQYHQRMIAEIQRVLPALKQTVAGFGLTNPREVDAYDAMIKRLEIGLGVDWSKFHSVHSAVKIAVPKKAKAAEAVNLANGGMVRGPGGPKDDAIPANLSNGEAVIDAATVKKNPGIIAALFQKKKIQIPGYAENNAGSVRLGSGASGRVGKSGTTVQRSYGGNVAATAGLVGFDLIDPKDLADLSSIYIKQIMERAEVKVSQLDAEIQEWVDANIEQIDRATAAVNSGTPPAEAFGPLIEKFNNDMEESGGAVSRVNQAFAEMTPQLQADLKEAQDYVKKYKLNLKESAEDAQLLKEALPNNMVANMAATPGPFGKFSKSRQAMTAIQGGVAAVEEKGSPRFMLSPGEHPSTIAYKAASSQEHFSTTAQQEEQRTRLAAQRLVNRQARVFADEVEEAAKNQTVSIGPAAERLAENITDTVGTGLDNASGAQSPSVEIAKATQNIVDGVEQTIVNSKDDVAKATEQMIAPVTKPIQASKFSSPFGNINAKEPVPAVGNAPREVVQAISQEATATRSFVGDIKASFAAIRANLAREFGWVKEEFKSLTGGIKTNTSAASQASIDAVQKNLKITEDANNQILVNGKKAGFNYVAAMQGRDGAIEAVVTKGNAAIITKATEAYNSGARLIPGFITDGLASKFPEFEFTGQRIGQVIASGAQRGALGAGAVAAPVMSGPQELPAMFDKRMEGVVDKQVASIQKFNGRMSTLAFTMSSVTGILSMFGGELSQVSGMISMTTGIMFGLMQINQMIATSVGTRTLLKTAASAGGFTQIFKDSRGASTGLKGFGKGLSGITAIFQSAFPIISRLLPAIAIATAAFAVFKVYSDVAESQKQKIEGLGNVATLTAEKISKLGNIFNVKTFETAFESVKPIVSGTGEAASIDQKTLIQQVQESENFAQDFKSEIQAIKESGQEEAELALKALAIKLTGKGFAKEQIDAIVGALVTEAGRTDVKLDMKSIDLGIESNRAALEAQIDAQMKIISEAYEDSYEKIRQEQKAQQADTASYGIGYMPSATSATASFMVGNIAQTMDVELKSTIHALAGVFESLFIGLSGQLASGQIEVKEFDEQFEILNNRIASMPRPEGLLLIESIIKNLPDSVQTLVNGLGDIADQMIVIKAATAGVNIESVLTEQEIADILAGSQEGAGTTAIYKKEVALRKLARATQTYADAVIEASKPIPLTPEQEIEAANESLRTQITTLTDQAAAFKTLKDAGIPAADAIRLLGDEALVAAAKSGKLDEETLKLINQLLAAQDAADRRGGTGGGSNPIQEAIDGLKKQRQEILNTSKAYSALRKSGMSAVKAYRFAQDPALVSAMTAGLKAGSKQWDEIIKRIKAAEAATKKWQKATVQGQTELFKDVSGKVSDYFSAQEQLLQATFEVNTAANQGIVNTLEKQIEGFNSQIEKYSRDLDDISDKEEQINAQYDKKVKALEQTKKINEDILRQQKSQLSIADALSQGDVAGAASAMQELRSQNAASALESQGNQLELGRSAQLAGVRSKDGLSRVELEKKIKDAKKEIAIIEGGSLKTAQDAIKAAEEKLQKDVLGLSYAGQTKAQWELQSAAIGAAEAKAVAFNSKAKDVLKTVTDIVAQWNALGTKTPTPPPAPKPKNKKAEGGFISGPGTATSDSIPALLSDGEYVVKASSVDKFGKSFLDSINAGSLPGFKKGGKVGDSQQANTEALFQKSQADQQANFDRAQKVAKGQAAAKANVAKKGKVFSEMFKNLIFDASSPEMAALSALPFGIGKVAKGLKGANQAKGIIPKPKGNFLSSRIKSKAELDEDARGLMGYNMSRYLGDANSIYSNPERSAEIARFFKLGDEMIPGELQMYRALSAGEVTGRLPRNVGDIYRPGTIKSAASAADLQALGELFTDLTKATGGKQNLAPGIAQIFTRKPIPGIEDLTKFLSTKKLDPRAAKASQFMKEYVLGPNTSYRVNSFTPGTKNSPPSWVLEAFIEKFAKGGMVKPSYFGGGGMAKKYAKGGMVKPSYFVDGGFARGTDTVPAMLTPGEFIVNRDSAKSFSPLLSAMNNGGLNFASPVYPEISRDYASANVGGGIYPSSDVPQSNTQVDNSVYNYSLSVNVEGTDASPDQIANVVMRKLQDFGSQRVRGQVVR